MRPILSPEEMRRADQRAIESGTPAVTLMQRAGDAVATTVLRVVGGRYRRRAVVVCGRGSNGGDGFVAARRLWREGLTVRCLVVDDTSSITGAAREHMDALERLLPVEAFDARALARADVIVDALFGTGFRGSAEGEAAAAIAAINGSEARVVAVDVPSGVDGATGAVPGPAVRADVTVALGAEKIGTAMAPGAALAGRVEVVDIGIDVSGRRLSAWMTDVEDISAVLPVRAPDAHKRSVGSVAVLGGSEGMSGAVILAARAAMRAGAGYVTVGCSRAVDGAVSHVLPEVLSRVVTGSEALGPDSLDRFQDVLDRADAVIVGPGLGRGDPQRRLVESLLEQSRVPIVLDADGLNVLEGRVAHVTEGRASGDAAALVATPHPAELARLLGTSVHEVQRDRLSAARRAADVLRCVVVLKGYRTLVALGDDVYVNPTGGPELATAGSGDVLSGVIAAFLASGAGAGEAARAGVFLHGLAGEQVAGAGGVVAWDVAEALPAAVRRARGGLPSKP